MLYRIYELLEKRIENMKGLKARNYDDKEDLSVNEKSIENILNILDILVKDLEDQTEFNFPYFAQLIDVSFNPTILRNIIQFGLSIFFNNEAHEEALTNFSSLFIMLTPYLKLLQKFNLDIKIIREKLLDTSHGAGPGLKNSNSLKDQFSGILEHEQVICEIVEADSSLAEKNETDFVHALSKRLCEKLEITLEKDEYRYFNLIGEARVAYILLSTQVNECLFPELMLIYSLQGNCLNTRYVKHG